MLVRAHAATVFTLVGIMPTAVIAASPPVERPALVERNSYGIVPRSARTIILFTPLAITEADLERWFWFAQLSEAQQHALRIVWESYRYEEQDVHFQWVQPVWDDASELTDFGGPARSVPAAVKFRHLVVRDREIAVRQVRSLEDRFFAQWEAFLTDGQLLLLDSIRKQRRRDHCRFYERYPAAQLDLVRLVHEHVLAGLDLAASDVMALALFLVEYDLAMAPHVAAREEAFVATMGEGVLLHALMATNGMVEWGTPGWHSAVELRDKLRSMNGRLTEIEKRIHDINVQFLGRLHEVVASPAAEMVRQEFQRRTYPGVYPDPTDLREVVERAVAIPALVEHQREAIIALGEADEARRRRLCDRMVRHFLEWRRFYGTEQAQGTPEWDAFEQAMTADWTERSVRAHSALAEMERVLDNQLDGDTASAMARVRHEMITASLVLEPKFVHALAMQR
jgi:hypothetical protein